MKEIIGELKAILDSSGNAAQLDDHPWTKSLSVRQHVRDNPELARQNPGYRLLHTLTDLFCEIMPSTPPRRGKRLDTNWGQFGMLAALYFGPLKFATPRPSTLRDAWGRIDQVIPLFVFGKAVEELPPAEVAPFLLVSEENDVAPTSTISDWHIHGLERLAEIFLAREQHLCAEFGLPSPVLMPSNQTTEVADHPPRQDRTQVNTRQIPRSSVLPLFRRYRTWLLVSLSLVLLLIFSWKAVRIYSLARQVKQDVDQLQAAVSLESLSLESVSAVGPLLSVTRDDVVHLRAELRPFLWAGKLFAWVPVYGGDAAAAADLLDLAAGLLVAGDEGIQAVKPVLTTIQDGGTQPTIPEIVDVLVAAQPRMDTAQQAVQEALKARESIEIEALSPFTRPLLEKIDPYLPVLGEGMAVLGVSPKLLGAAEDGPQTYLFLIQNEDELRATGGFITAVATVTLDRGEMIGFKVQDSYAVDDFSKTYPRPPWQLQEHMYFGMLLLRDANWSPNFPTTATWAEHLFAYYSAHSVDGVIAIDQEVIRLLLEAVGPLQLSEADQAITAANVITFMRAEKDETTAGDPNRKDFLSDLATALLAKIQGPADVSWQALARVLIQAFEEKHIQVQLDDPVAAEFLASQRWDGAVRRDHGDFLMVVDYNMGYNKVNAVASTEIQYEVDLSVLQDPTGKVTLIHRNPTQLERPCDINESTITGYQDLIERCYWNYVRLYTLSASTLISATPHEVPAEWTVTGTEVPARVDILSNNGLIMENPEGLQAYGTYLVVPLNDERQTRFALSLSPEVLEKLPDGTWRYQLFVPKQAGTHAVPLQMRVQLPEGGQLISANPQGSIQDQIWLADLVLRTDRQISLQWQMPAE